MNTFNNIFSLKGKIAVISGGAGLYGRQFVRGLAIAGAKVYMASRNVEANEKYAQELRKENLEVYAEYLDLADESSIIKLCDDIYAKEGRVDILVNNSVARTMTGYSDTKENFDKSMTINATGLFLITRAFGNRMCQAQTGSIINIESYVKQYSEATCLGRMAYDTDVLGAVVFLASDASAYITGAVIPVDGGYSAK